MNSDDSKETADSSTIISAQSERYEMIELRYEIVAIGVDGYVKVTAIHTGPVIAWRIFKSIMGDAYIATPIGMGFNMDKEDDWYSSPSEGAFAAPRAAIVWYDRRTTLYHTVIQAGHGRIGWENVCKAAIEYYSNSEVLKKERVGAVWQIGDPPTF